MPSVGRGGGVATNTSHSGSATEHVLLGIACVVTFVWAVATMVQVFVPSHPVPGYANLVMMTVASFFFGGAILSGRKNGNGGNGNGGNGDKSRSRSILDAALERGKKVDKGSTDA